MSLKGNHRYHLAPEEPDLCGYVLTTDTGDRLGEVVDAIADTGSMTVSHLIVSLDDVLIGEAKDRCVFIPLDMVRIEAGATLAVCPNCNERQLLQMPSYPGGDLPPDLAERLEQVFGEGAQAA